MRDRDTEEKFKRSIDPDRFIIYKPLPKKWASTVWLGCKKHQHNFEVIAKQAVRLKSGGCPMCIDEGMKAHALAMIGIRKRKKGSE